MMGADGDASTRPRWRWEVALSFAGTQREYVGQVAAALKARGVRCFYDADEQIRLWGTHLAEELPRIYAQESAAVVVFVSADYAAGSWTRLERRATFSRAVSEAGVYVLPARFDDSELPGLQPDVVYIDLRLYTAGQFAELVVAKLRDLAVSLPPTPGGVGGGIPARARAKGPSHLAKTLDAGSTWRFWEISHVHSVAFSPDGTLLASAGSGETVRLWQAPAWNAIRTLTGHQREVTWVAFSPDGMLLASAGSDKTIRLWETATGAPVRTLTHGSWVNVVAFSPDGTLLASAGSDGTVRLWQAPAWNAIRAWTGHEGSEAGTVVFSPDGMILASAGDSTVRLWDTTTGTLVRIMARDIHWTTELAFSPDGRLLASAATDNTVRLWETATGAPVHTLMGHENQVHAVAFSPDGTLLASAGTDNAVRLWETATGTPIRALTHGSWVSSLAFSPDGTLLASGGGDKKVKLWR